MLSAFLYALFSGGPYIEGSGSNTEVFMVFFLMLAFYFFLAYRKSGWGLLACGLLAGLAFMTKQTAFLIFWSCAFCFDRSMKGTARRLLPLCIGFLLVPAGFLVYFWANRGLSDFIDAFMFNFGYIQPSLDLFLVYRTFTVALLENSVIWRAGRGGGGFYFFPGEE